MASYQNKSLSSHPGLDINIHFKSQHLKYLCECILCMMCIGNARGEYIILHTDSMLLVCVLSNHVEPLGSVLLSESLLHSNCFMILLSFKSVDLKNIDSFYRCFSSPLPHVDSASSAIFDRTTSAAITNTTIPNTHQFKKRKDIRI